MRRKRAEKRIRKPDPRYNDILIGRFINSIMEDGQKQVAKLNENLSSLNNVYGNMLAAMNVK